MYLMIKEITRSELCINEHIQIFSFRNKEDLEKQFQSMKIDLEQARFVLDSFDFNCVDNQIRIRHIQNETPTKFQIYTLINSEIKAYTSK